MSGYEFVDDEEEEYAAEHQVQAELHQVRQQYQPQPREHRARYQETQQQQKTKISTTRRKPMANKQTTSIGSLNLEEEIRSIVKAKNLTDEQAAGLFQFWTSYFDRRPEEMARLYYLRDENPDEFRAVLFTLPFAGNRHKIETCYFLMAMFGLGCSLLFLITWFTGAFDSNRGWNHARSKGALPNVVEALYNR